MQILTITHWIRPRDPNGRVRRRIEGAEVDFNLIGITVLSPNPEPSDFLGTKPPKSIHGPVYESCYICRRGQSYLESMGGEVLEPVEDLCPSVREC